MQFLIDIALILLYLCAFFLLCAWTWRFWKMYINQKFLDKFTNDSIMLEIKLPREVTKSPLAMEIAMSSLLQGGGIANWYKRNFLGNLATHFSLEIASLEGIIHFYIRMEKKFRPLVEANLYAQYPGIEIIETDDYTSCIRYHHLSKDVDMWGATYPLSRKIKIPSVKDKGKTVDIKADYLPIKTYVDYGLDKNPEEEFKIDPLTPLLEFMGGVGKGEYVWYQVMVQDESSFNGKDKFPKTYVNPETHEHFTLADLADMRKKQIRKYKQIKKGDLAYDQQGNPIQKTIRGKEGEAELQPVTYAEDREMQLKESELLVEEKDEIEMINRKLSKPLARAIVRLIYVAKKDSFNGAHINNILNIMRPFNDTNPIRNQFGLQVVDPYDYPWENFMGRRVPWRKEEKFEAFVEREGFFPHIGKRKILDRWEDTAFWNSSMKTRKLFRMIVEAIFFPFQHPDADEVITLNLEELATLWHLPGSVAGVPTLPRIDSNKGVAPVNLPQ